MPSAGQHPGHPPLRGAHTERGLASPAAVQQQSRGQPRAVGALAPGASAGTLWRSSRALMSLDGKLGPQQDLTVGGIFQKQCWGLGPRSRLSLLGLEF